MRQAIEEGFILDVLKGYTTYKRFFQLAKSVADDPELDKKKAASALARFVNLHPSNVAQKTEIIIEHFRACVMYRLKGRAKAMLVTSSRLMAVKPSSGIRRPHQGCCSNAAALYRRHYGTLMPLKGPGEAQGRILRVSYSHKPQSGLSNVVAARHLGAHRASSCEALRRLQTNLERLDEPIL
jgi:hypothetical protein